MTKEELVAKLTEAYPVKKEKGYADSLLDDAHEVFGGEFDWSIGDHQIVEDMYNIKQPPTIIVPITLYVHVQCDGEDKTKYSVARDGLGMKKHLPETRFGEKVKKEDSFTASIEAAITNGKVKCLETFPRWAKAAEAAKTEFANNSGNQETNNISTEHIGTTCADCGKEIQGFQSASSEKMAQKTIEECGRPLCFEHRMAARKNK